MSLRFMEGFDDGVLAGGYGGKWSTFTAAQVGAAYGRNGNGYRVSSVSHDLIRSDTGWLGPGLTSIVGVAARFNSFPSSLSSNSFFIFMEYNNGMKVCLGPTDIAIYRASSFEASAAHGMVTGDWHYIEFKVYWGSADFASDGYAEVRIDGAVVVTTAADLQLSPADNGQQMGFRANGFSVDMDDIYAADVTGTLNNDYLGDVKVETVLPDGNGTNSGLVGSDGNSTDNYLLVDDMDPTDYVGSGTAGDKDTYAFGALATASGSVHGVQTVPLAAKTDAGAISGRSVALSSATEATGDDEGLSTDYGVHPHIFETDPNTAAQWTVAGVNAAEFGWEVRA